VGGNPSKPSSWHLPKMEKDERKMNPGWNRAQQNKTGQPGAPRGCPEPSRLEGHVTVATLAETYFSQVAGK
jgi:hypothetical protein